MLDYTLADYNSKLGVYERVKHTVTLDLGKIANKNDLSINVGKNRSDVWRPADSAQSTTPKTPGSNTWDTNPRKETALQATQEKMYDEEEVIRISGLAQNPIVIYSSSDGLTPIKSTLVGKPTRHNNQIRPHLLPRYHTQPGD